MNPAYKKLMEKADTMQIIDTHEHLQPHKSHLLDAPDFICDYFSHYITSDLTAAGMPQEELSMIPGSISRVYDRRVDIRERYAILEPYLDLVRNTSYFRSLTTAAAKLYQIPDITRETIALLNEKFQALNGREDYRRHVMKEVCHIQISINDCWRDDLPAVTTELFTPAWHPDAYVSVGDKLDCVTLSDYCAAYKKHFLQQLRDGMCTLKCALAYSRSLYFEEVEAETAAQLFAQFDPEEGEPAPKALQDYMMHQVLALADEAEFVIQIHTGLQEGMYHNLADSNPMLLKNLFGKYRRMRFDLFHIGYPYDREIITLAKYFPNVYVDMCWAHIISPAASRAFLREAMDVLPYSKILGFGGDYMFYDGVCGHLTMAKQNICEVLAEKVERGEISEALAETMLQAILHDNAARVFRIE